MRQMLLGLIIIVMLGGGGAVLAEPVENWRDEFDRICSKTGEAGQLSETELDQLVSDSERLREKIVISNDQASKVYLFRIGKCRDFFVFMKETVAAAPKP